MNQELNVPLTLSSKGSRVVLSLTSDEAIDKLILDPKGIIWRMGGMYGYILQDKLVNELRSLRDKRKVVKPQPKREVWFDWGFDTEDRGNQEILQALFEVSQYAAHQQIIEGSVKRG